MVQLATTLRERRLKPRIPCDIKTDDDQIIRNLSQVGLYLESRKEYRLNERVDLTFPLFSNSPRLQVVGQIVRSQSIDSNRYAYGVCLKNLGAEEYNQLQYFILHKMTAKPEKSEQKTSEPSLKVQYHSLVVQTERENLSQLDPRLGEFLRLSDYFYIHDFTKDLKYFVEKSGITDGTVTAQILHTSATLCVNELDEPMLLMDITRKLRAFAPKEGEYLHNSPLRTVNLCADDSHCDRNGDAHVKAALFGQPSITLIVRNGKLVVGQWQKVALIEFDGPRRREILIQVAGI